jgi:hypothetical protein
MSKAKANIVIKDYRPYERNSQGNLMDALKYAASTAKDSVNDGQKSKRC